MTLLKHELKQSRISFTVWTAAIVFFICTCIFMFPEMKNQMNEVSEIFASMGSFSQAFGMDRLNFGTLIGFYSAECGNILGIGGAFFAALLGISSLAKEEKEHTAEFLLTHPISRTRVVIDKLLAVIIEIIVMNLITFGVAAVSVAAIGEEIPLNELILIHTAYLIMQLEIGCICFGISAFIRRGSIGIGLGLAAVMYFLNIISNISDSAEFLKYITPYGYTNGADITADLKLDAVLILLGSAYAAAAVILGYINYSKKDII